MLYRAFIKNAPYTCRCKQFKLKQMIARIILVSLLGLFAISCKSNKTKNTEESEFLTDSIYSKNLSEYRKHNIYLPKGFTKEKKYPIIYATDGNNSITDKKKVLDSLIENEFIKPLIFVASFSNNKIADSTSTTLGNGDKVYLSYRNFEYVNRKPTRIEDSLLVDRFKNHMSYFVNELITHVEQKFNQHHVKDDRYFYGVSNGAGFGMSLLNTKPELIGTYLCFSTFGGDIQSNEWVKKKKYPILYLKYGSEEPFFLRLDAEFLKPKYELSNSFIEIKEYNGGHNNKYWNQEFIETLSKTLN